MKYFVTIAIKWKDFHKHKNIINKTILKSQSCFINIFLTIVAQINVKQVYSRDG
jgi:hypothetical protein